MKVRQARTTKDEEAKVGSSRWLLPTAVSRINYS
jgi:hypothetical protein